MNKEKEEELKKRFLDLISSDTNKISELDKEKKAIFTKKLKDAIN